VLKERLRLPESSQVVFERPPLVLTVFQVRFSNHPEITEQSYVEPFRQAIQDRYPTFSPLQQVGVQFDALSGQPQPLETNHWRFSDEGENWVVVLAPDFLALETRRYEHFEDFLSQLRFVLDALVEHVRPRIGIRLGLRYINEIRIGTESVSSIIRRELLGPLSVAEFEEHTARSFQEITLDFSEDQAIQIRHGLFPDGTVVQPRPTEQPPTGPFYLLDFDAYRTFSAPARLKMEPDIIHNHVKEYHGDIEKLFRWSMTEEFTDSLGVRTDDD
jgi:uncharacterized protein (TIGR04255 family)